MSLRVTCRWFAAALEMEGLVALRDYGVLKGKAIEVRLGAGQSPHYQVRIVDDTTDYRIAVNVKSQLPPSDVEFIVIEHFQHPITPIVEPLPKASPRSSESLAQERSTSSEAISSTARRCGRCPSVSLASTTTSTRSSIA